MTINTIMIKAKLIEFKKIILIDEQCKNNCFLKENCYKLI